MKEYECVKVEHHKDVGKTVERFQRNGWHLHTYQTAGMGASPVAFTVYHYLLFERETEKNPSSVEVAAATAAATAAAS